MPERLVALSSAYAGEVRSLGDRTNIGRGDENEIRLLDESVSRQHACIARNDDGRLVLHDMRSGNGTTVNGTRVTHHVLVPGDEVQIGSTRFRFENVEAAESRPVSAPGEPEEWEAEIRAAETMLPRACDSPLHGEVSTNGWRFCPACGDAPG